MELVTVKQKVVRDINFPPNYTADNCEAQTASYLSQQIPLKKKKKIFPVPSKQKGFKRKKPIITRRRKMMKHPCSVPFTFI